MQQSRLNEQASLVLVKNLIRIGFSSICYLRHLFGEECFEDLNVAGIPVKGIVLTNETKTLCAWLEDGVFDALTKKYLSTVVFGVFSNGENSVPIESYSFTISYLDGSVQMNVSHNGTDVFTDSRPTKSSIRKSTARLIRTFIQLSSTLRDLPEEHHIGLAIYYNDTVPQEYEPKHFHPATHDESLEFTIKPLRMHLGSVSTDFHRLDVQMKTITDFLIPRDEAETLLDSSRKYKERFPICAEPNDEVETTRRYANQMNSPRSERSSDPQQRTFNPAANAEREWYIHPSSQQSTNSLNSQNPECEDSGASPTFESSPTSSSTVQSSPTFENSPLLNSSPTVPLEPSYEAVRAAVLIAKTPTKRFIHERFPQLSAEIISDFLERMVADGTRYGLECQQSSSSSKYLWHKALRFVLEHDTVSQATLKGFLDAEVAVTNDLIACMETFGILETNTDKRKSRVVIKSKRNASILRIINDTEVHSSQSNLSQDVNYINEAAKQQISSPSPNFSPSPPMSQNPRTVRRYGHARAAIPTRVASPTEEIRNRMGDSFTFLDSQNSDTEKSKRKLSIAPPKAKRHKITCK